MIIAITGSSGVNLAVKFIKYLPKNKKYFVILSKNAKLSYKLEFNKSLKKEIKNSNIEIFLEKDISAKLASGSFRVKKFVIIPCSINTLAKCANGISDNLITRSFLVSLKEKRKILIAPREMPLDTITIENMQKLSSLGVIIAPPIIGYYSKPNKIDDMEKFIIGKWYDLLKIKHNLYKRWS